MMIRLSIAGALATAAVTATLQPLIAGGSWWWDCLGAILVVTGAGIAASRLRLRPWAVPPVMLAVTLVFLTAAFAPGEAWLRIVPTEESLGRLGDLVSTGFGEIQRYSAPVPATPGVRLITAGGVALIAILVDWLAIRLRSAAAAGMPLLALFTVPAAVLTEPIAWPVFVLAAAGYLGLLAADGRERLHGWGPVITLHRARAVSRRRDLVRPALPGKRIGAAAVALAVVVPALLPTLTPNPVAGFGAGNGTGAGGGTIGIPDAVAELGGQLRRFENRIVLTYTSSDDRPRYLRIYALDVFDGVKWTVGSLRGRPQDRVSAGPLPPAPGLGPDVEVARAEMEIKISDEISELRFLPLPYPATRVEAEGDWRADRATLTVFSTSDEAAGLEYRVEMGEPRPTADQLDAAGVEPPDERYLALPDDLDPRIAALAEEVTQEADTPYRKAVALQRWFTETGGFTYSLLASGSGSRAIARFLLTSRAGYCEQFASAMAVMARILGIPARVSIGYTGGTRSEDSWVVTTHDAHAWPELYFDGIGWLRFEPTPSGATGQGTAEPPSYTLPAPPTVTPSAGPSAAASAEPDEAEPTAAPTAAGRRAIDDPDLGAVPTGQDTGVPGAVKAGLVAVLVLLVALIPAGVRRAVWLRRRRVLGGGAPAPAIEAAWAELCDTLTDLGLARLPSESPRALCRRISERHGLGGADAASLAAIGAAQERLSYAPSPGGAAPTAEDLRRVRRALARTVSRWRRAGAVLAPASTFRRARALAERALDLFDMLEAVRIGRARG
ncbi:MAG: DUF3488 and transglutaminase-like domain-containing protein [Actinomycetales bacterium]|uniref:transglutaminase family protein n=1 Tax=Thermobispora bispora TaxID=2006 RepID=UPI00197E45DC|nr:DUF3488 and transglutaminase-like domain-containing protein [Thermobispora bispora]MBO2474013.1 transglutaminase [Actinomycetales bacterium]QSI47970.1 transglutaminase domain-containing protein [Thermobispora bispora]